MKLTFKLAFILILGVIITLTVDGYISYRRQVKLFETEMRLDASLLGHTMKSLLLDTWQSKGQEHTLKLIRDIDKEERLIDMRWIWLNPPLEDPFTPRISRERLGPVMHGQEMSFKKQDENGNGYFFFYIPIKVDEKRLGALELSESLSWADDYKHAAFVRIIVLTGVLVLLNAFAVPLLGLRMIGKPLNKITKKMQLMGGGDFLQPLQLPGHDELSVLASGLNKTCEQIQEAWERARNETELRIATLEQLRHEDRLKTVGRLASGIAHELGTPLNVISGRAGLIARGNMSQTEIMDNANTIKGQSDRITNIIRQLLDFARRRSTRKSSVDLKQMVHRTMDLIVPLGRKQKVEFCLADDDDTPIETEVDAEQIQQVLINILTNSLQAMPQGGTVEAGISRVHTCPPEGHDGAEGDYLCIYVRDEGQGISEEDLCHIFEPFFTTKDTGKGTGLGLSIAYGIVREHGGWIDAESEVGKGSCFRIYLPQEVE